MRTQSRRKDQLVAVAAELFRTRGYHAVGINDIAGAAGLTGPAVYRHFADKQTILAEVLLSGVEEMCTATATALARNGRLARADLAEDRRPAGAGFAEPGRPAGAGVAGDGRGAGAGVAGDGRRARDGLAWHGLDALVNAVAAASVDRRDLAALWRREIRHLAPDQRRAIGRRSRTMLASWVAALCAARPSLTEADASLLCWAALSVFGSVSTHHTTVARPRFVQLIAGVAGRVLGADLPPAAAPVAPPASPVLPPSAASPVGPPSAASPVSPAPSAAGPQSRRAQVLSAAAELFDRHGFHAVTMDDIGSAVGIAGPSIYRHFPGKQAILYAIARRAADRLATDVDDAMRGNASEVAALHRLIASYVRVLTTAPELTVAFSIDTASLDDAERAELIRVQRDYVTRWAGLLQVVRPSLTLREAKVTTHAALAVANDLARARRFAGRPDLMGDLRALMAAALDI